MGGRPSTRAVGAHPATILPGSPPTAPRPWTATSSVNRATSSSKAGRGTCWCISSVPSPAPRHRNGSSRPTRRRRSEGRAHATPQTAGNSADKGRGRCMADKGPQKDAMDVLQAWVDDFNVRARPAIRLGSKGEAGGGRLRLQYSPAEDTGSIFHMVAVKRNGRPPIPLQRVEGPTAGDALQARMWAHSQLRP